MRNKAISYITKVAMLSALAVVIMQFKFPVFFAPGFYKMEFSDLPALLGAFAMGPLAGVIIEAVKVLLNLVIDGTTTMLVGEAANFIFGCAYVLPAAFVYKFMHNKKGALVSVCTGTASLCLFGCVINAFVLLPFYAWLYKMPIDALVGMGTAINSSITGIFSFVMLAVLPLNLLKGAVTSLVTMLIYKPLSPLLKK